MTAKVVVVALGVAFEITGTVLVFLPELAPRWRRLRARAGQLARQVANRVRKLVGRPPGGTVYVDAATAGMRLSGSGIGVTSVDAAAPLDRKLSFLIKQAEELQRRVGELENTVGDLPARWRSDLEDLRKDLRSFVETELGRARELHIRPRLAGVGCLLIGSSLLAAANLM